MSELLQKRSNRRKASKIFNFHDANYEEYYTRFYDKILELFREAARQANIRYSRLVKHSPLTYEQDQKLFLEIQILMDWFFASQNHHKDLKIRYFEYQMELMTEFINDQDDEVFTKEFLDGGWEEYYIDRMEFYSQMVKKMTDDMNYERKFSNNILEKIIEPFSGELDNEIYPLNITFLDKFNTFWWEISLEYKNKFQDFVTKKKLQF